MRRLGLTCAAALLLAGCSSGSDGNDPAPTSAAPSASDSTASASTPSATPAGPPCADIWVAGQELPADYESCDDQGQPGEQEVTDCLDGSRLVVFQDQFYALTGTPIVEPDIAPLQDTEEYATAFGTCTGQ